MAEGALIWLIPDAYLATPQGDGPYYSHESVCVLNTTTRDARLTLTFYYEDQPPLIAENLPLGAERCRHIRLDRPEQIGGLDLPRDVPYGIRLVSDVPVTVQYSRIDTTQVNATLMTTIAHPLR